MIYKWPISQCFSIDHYMSIRGVSPFYYSITFSDHFVINVFSSWNGLYYCNAMIEISY
jgi:hypothetical protein